MKGHVDKSMGIVTLNLTVSFLESRHCIVFVHYYGCSNDPGRFCLFIIIQTGWENSSLFVAVEGRVVYYSWNWKT
jgi:hypothetical protein